MAQFRPISIRNVSYKIVSKVLCQRLKKVLCECIPETQLAFVAGWHITYSIMNARKCFMLSEQYQVEDISEWPLKRIWAKHMMIVWSGILFTLSWKIWNSRIIGSSGLCDVSHLLNTMFSWIDSKWATFSYNKEILYLLSSLSCACKRSLTF